ncbi:MAG: mechanosensitive ion channel [Magnetospirillum sp.]|nr:mechanosensitive ion channel [Magnetospirillum sp.]
MPDLSAATRYTDLALTWGGNLLWATLTIAIGWTVAGWAHRGIAAALGRTTVGDATLAHFAASLARWAVLVVAGIAALEHLGVQTTSVVAVLGAAGLAVGLALQGTLSNLAAGVMLIVFRPFKVGDSIESGALAGKVGAVTLFHTMLITGDNVQVVAPNAVLWSGALRNLTFHATRRVELLVAVPLAAGHDAVTTAIGGLMKADSRIAQSPAPSVTVTRFLADLDKAELSVKVWCATGDADSVKADLAAAIWREGLAG